MSQKEKKNPGRKYGEARSVWEREVSFPEYPSLAEDIETEVAVIGGGLTGILTGCFLYKAGKKGIRWKEEGFPSVLIKIISCLEGWDIEPERKE